MWLNVAVFIVLVILRCCRQHLVLNKEEEIAAEEEVQGENKAVMEDLEVQQEEQEEALPLVVATEVKSQ